MVLYHSSTASVVCLRTNQQTFKNPKEEQEILVLKKPLGFTVDTCFLTVTQMLCVKHRGCVMKHVIIHASLPADHDRISDIFREYVSKQCLSWM